MNMKTIAIGTRNSLLARLAFCAALFAVAIGGWGQSRIPADSNNYLQVAYPNSSGDPDVYQVTFFEVPDTVTTPLYFAINSPGNTGSLPDNGTAGTTNYYLVGGSGALSSPISQQVYFSSLADAITGTTIQVRSFTTEGGWCYLDAVMPDQGEHIGSSYYFKVVAEAPNTATNKNAFQLDASFSGIDGTSPSEITSIRAFAYAWTLGVRLQSRSWKLYPFVPAGTSGSIYYFNWDTDSNVTMSAYNKTNANSMASSVGSVTRAGNCTTWPTNAVSSSFSIGAETGGTWGLNLVEAATGTDPDTMVIWATNSSTPTSSVLRTYASYWAPIQDHATVTVASSTAISGSSVTGSVQVVDSSGVAVPGVAAVRLVASGGSSPIINASGANLTLTTDTNGYASFSFTSGTGIVTLTPYTDGSGSPVSSSLANAASATPPTVTFAVDQSPTLTQASTLSYLSTATTINIPTLTIADSGSANVTTANGILLRFSNSNASFLTSVTAPTLTVGGTGAGAVSATVGYASGICNLTVSSNFGVANTLTISGLQIDPASDSPGSSYLQMSVDGGSTWISANRAIVVNDPNQTYVWTGTTDHSWATTTNWSPNISGGPPSSANVVFSSTYTNSLTLTGALSAKNLTVSSGEALNLGINGMTLSGNLELASNASLISSGSSTVAGNLNVAGGATLNLGSGSLSVVGAASFAGSVSLSGTINSTGALSFSYPITLVGDTTLDTSASGATITLNTGATVTGSHGFTVNSGTGAKSFASVIGASTSPTAWTVNGTGLATFSASAYTITGNTTIFNSPVEISSTQTIHDAGEIQFNSTLTVDGGVTLTARGLDVDFGATITGSATSSLVILPHTVGAGLSLGGADGSTSLRLSGAELGFINAATFASISLGTSSDTVTVDNVATLGGGVTAALTLGGSLSITTGSLSLGCSLDIAGGMSVAGSLDFASHQVTIGGTSINLTAGSTISNPGTLIVTGTTSLTSNAKILGSIQVGNATSGGALSLSDALTLSGSLGFGSVGVVRSLNISSRTMSIGGNADFTNATALTATGSTLTFTGMTSGLTSAGKGLGALVVGSSAKLTLSDPMSVASFATTGTCTFDQASQGATATGDVTLTTNTTLNNIGPWTFAGATSLTSAGRSFAAITLGDTGTGTESLSLADDMTQTGSFSVVASSGSGTRDLTISNHTWTFSGASLNHTNLSSLTATGSILSIAGTTTLTTSSGLHFNTVSIAATGALTLAASSNLALATNFDHSAGGGAFSAGTSSTLSFVDSSVTSQILGSSTFENLYCDVAGKVIEFESGKTQTINGAFTISIVTGSLITLRGTSGAAWTLDLGPSFSSSVDYAKVSYGLLTGKTTTINTGTHSQNAGNNDVTVLPYWSFPSINWVGSANATDGFDWSLGSNWDTGIVPGTYDAVEIPVVIVGHLYPRLTASPTAVGGVTIDSGASLDLHGCNFTINTSFSNSGTLYLQGDETISGITSAGNTVYDGTGNYRITPGKLAAGNSYGTLAFTGSGQWLMNANAALSSLSISAGASLDIVTYDLSGVTSIANNGTLRIGGTATQSLNAIVPTNALGSTVDYYNSGSVTGFIAGNSYYNLVISDGTRSLSADLVATTRLTVSNAASLLTDGHGIAAGDFDLSSSAPYALDATTSKSLALSAPSGVDIGLGSGAGACSLSNAELAKIRSQSLSVTASGTGAIAVDGVVGTGTAATGALTLSGAAALGFSGTNTFASGLSASTSLAAGMSIDADNTELVATGAGATISLGKLAALTHALTISADEIGFSGGSNSVTGSGALTLRENALARPISFGSSLGASYLNLDTTDIAAFSTGGFSSVTIGRSDGTALMTMAAGTYSGITTPLSFAQASVLGDGSGGVSLTTNGANITFDKAVSIADSRSIALSTIGGAIMTAKIGFSSTIEGNAGVGNESLSLTSGSGGVSITGPVGGTDKLYDLTISSGAALILPNVGLTHNLSATTTAGDITDSGTLSIAGAAVFHAPNTANITLDTATNNFNSFGVTQGGNATVYDTNGIVLDNLNITGTSPMGILDIHAGGTITQSGIISAATMRATSSTTTAGSGGISLNTSTNVISTFCASNASTDNIALTNGAALTLGDATLASVSTASGGSVTITNAGAVTVAHAVSAGTGTITINSGAGAVLNGGGTITADAIYLQTGTGAGAVGAAESGKAILLSTSTPGTTTTSLHLGGGNLAGAYVSSTGALSLSAPSLAANAPLYVVADGLLTLPASAIDTGSGALTLASGTNLATAANLSSTNAIALTASAGTLGINYALNGGSVTLVSSGTTTLAAGITTTGGAIDLSGAAGGIVVGAASVSLATGSGNPAAAGLVSFGTHDVWASAAGSALTLDTTTTGGSGGAVTIAAFTNGTSSSYLQDLTIRTTGSTPANSGALTDTTAYPMHVTGTTTIAIGTTSVTTLMSDAANNFGTVAITSARNVAVRDADGIIVGASTLTGALTVTAGGAITQSGIISAATMRATSSTTTAGSGGIALNTSTNVISTFCASNASTDSIALTNGAALTLGDTTLASVSTASGGAVTITNNGAVAVAYAVSAGTGTVSLDTGGTGTITGAGTITADTILLQTGTGSGSVGTSSAARISTASSTGPTILSLGNGTNSLANAYISHAGALTLHAFSMAAVSTVDILSTGAIGQDQAISGVGLVARTCNAAGVAPISLGASANGFSSVELRAMDATNMTAVDTDISYQGSAGFDVVGIVTGATSGKVHLRSGAAVTHSGAISAQGLELLGTGPYTLNSLANSISAIAGNVTGGSVSFSNTGDLSVGTVVTVGLKSSSAVSVTAMGQLTVTTGGIGAGTSVDLIADTMVIGDLVSSTGAGRITVRQLTNGVAINLGTTTGALDLNATEVGFLSNNDVIQLGDAHSGVINISSAVGDSGRNYRLYSGSDITGAGTFSANSLALSSVGAINVTTASVGTIAASSSSGAGITISDANASGMSVGTVDGVAGIASTDGAISITETSGDLTVANTTAATDVNAGSAQLSLIASGAGKTLTLAPSSAIASDNAAGLLLQADGMDLGGAVNGGANLVTLRSRTGAASWPIDLGSTAASGLALELSDAELKRITTTGYLRIGSSSAPTSGNISISASIAPTSAPSLHLISNGTIAQSSGTITATNLALSSSGVISGIDSAVHSIAANSGGNNAIAISNSRGAGSNLVVGSLDGVTGIDSGTATLRLSETTGGITVSNAISVSSGMAVLSSAKNVTQGASITAGSLKLAGTGSFTLTDASNSFGAIASKASGSISLFDSDGYSVGSFDGAIGIDSTAASGGGVTLDSGSGNITLNYGISTNGGAVWIRRPAILGADLAIDSDAAGGSGAAGNITFAGTVGGTHRLVADASADGGGASGTVDFQSTVGGTPLSSLSASGANVYFAGDVTTNGTSGEAVSAAAIRSNGTHSATAAPIDFGSASTLTLLGDTRLQSGSGSITLGSVTDGGSSYTLTLGDAANTQTGAVTVNGVMTIYGLATCSGHFNILLNQAVGTLHSSVDTAVTFYNTDALTIGNDSLDSFAFTSGVTKTTSGLRTLAGTISTNNAAIDFGTADNIALAATTVLDPGNGQIDLYEMTTAGTYDLDIRGSGAVNIGNSGTSFLLGSGALVLSGKTAGAVVMDGTTVTMGGITMPATAQAFTLNLRGDATTVTAAANLTNMASLTLGNADTDSFTFSNGLTKTSSDIYLRGTIDSSSHAINLSAAGTLRLDGNTTIKTGTDTLGLSAVTVNGAGQNLILHGTNAATIASANLGTGTLDLSNRGAGGNVSLMGSLSAASMSLPAVDTAFDLSLNGGSVTNQVVLTHQTGALAIGASGFTFTSGMTKASGAIELGGGDVLTSGAAHDIGFGSGSVTVTANTSLGGVDSSSTGAFSLAGLSIDTSCIFSLGNSSANVNAFTINGAVEGPGSLTVNTGGTADFKSSLGATTGIGALTLDYSNGSHFESTTHAATLALNGTATSQTIAFDGALTVDSGMTTGTGSFNIAFNQQSGTQSSTIAGSTTIATTSPGTITLGDDPGDIVTFTGGLAATSNASRHLVGKLRTAAAAINLGAVILDGDATIDATNGGLSVAGQAISLGAVTGSTHLLVINAGNGASAIFTSAGTITASSLRIIAYGNIGTGGIVAGTGIAVPTYVNTAVSNLEAMSHNGTVFISNAGAVNIGFTGGDFELIVNGGLIASGANSIGLAASTGSNIVFAKASAAGTSGAFAATGRDINTSVDLTGNGGISLYPNADGLGIALNDGTGTFALTAAELRHLVSTGTTTIGLTSGTGSVNTIRIGSSGNVSLGVTDYSLSLDSNNSPLYFDASAAPILSLNSAKTLGIDIGTGAINVSGLQDISLPGATSFLDIVHAGNIGSGTGTSALQTAVGQIALASTGTVYVSESDDLSANTLTTSGGALTVAAGGILTLSQGVATGASGAGISLSGSSVAFTAASAARVGAANDSEIDITANSGNILDTGAAQTTLGASGSGGILYLRASSGIGASASARLHTEVGAIRALTAIGGIFLSEADGVKLGDGTEGIRATTSGSIDLVAGGSITTGTSAIGASDATSDVYLAAGAGSTLSISDSLSAGRIVDLTGPAGISVTGSVSGGSGLMTFHNDVTHSAGAINDGTGGLRFSGSYSASGSASLVGSTGGNPDMDFRGTTVTFAGFTHNDDRIVFSQGLAQDFNCNSNALAGVAIGKSGGSVTLQTSDVTQAAANAALSLGCSGAVSLVLNGRSWTLGADLVMDDDHSTLIVGSGALVGGTHAITVGDAGGSGTLTAGTGSITNSGDFKVGNASASVSLGTGTITTGAMSIAAGSFSQTGNNQSAVGGPFDNSVASLTVSGTGICDWDFSDNAGTLTIQGNIDNSGYTNFHSKVVTIGGSMTGAIVFMDLVIPSGKSITRNTGSSLTVYRNVTIDNGGSYTHNGLPLTLGGSSVTSGTYTDNNPVTKQDLGAVTLVAGGAATAKALGSSILMSSLTIGPSVDLATVGYGLTVSGGLGGSGSLTASASEAIAVGGSMSVAAFTPASSHVTFDGASDSSCLGYGFYDLTMDMAAAGAKLTPSAGISVTHSMALTRGVFDAGSYTHAIAGDWDSSGASVGFTQGTSTIALGSATPVITTKAGQSFANLMLSRGGSLGSDTTVSGNFHAANSGIGGALDLAGHTLTVGGNLDLKPGTTGATLTHGNARVVLDGGVQGLTTNGQSFYDLTLYAESGIAAIVGDLTIDRNLEVQSGRTLDMSANALTVFGTTNAAAGNAGTITSTSGAQTFTGSFTVGSLTASSSTTSFGGSSVVLHALSPNNGQAIFTGANALSSNAQEFFDVRVASGATLTPQDTMIVNRHFAIDDGGSFAHNGKSLTLGGAGGTAGMLSDSNTGPHALQNLGAVTVNTAAKTSTTAISASSLAVSSGGFSIGSNALSVSGALSLTGGSLDLGTATVKAGTISATGGSLVLGSAAIGLSAAPNVITTATISDVASSITLGGAGNLTLPSTATIGDLVVDADTALIAGGNVKGVVINASRVLGLSGASNAVSLALLAGESLVANGTLRVADSTSAVSLVSQTIGSSFSFSGTDIDYNGRTLTIRDMSAPSLATSLGAGAAVTLEGSVSLGALALSGDSSTIFRLDASASLTVAANASPATSGSVQVSTGSLELGAGSTLSCADLLTQTGTSISAPAAAGASTSISSSGKVSILGAFSDPTHSTLLMTGTGVTLASTPDLGNLRIGSGTTGVAAALSATVTLASAITVEGELEINDEGSLDVSSSSHAISFLGDTWTNRVEAVSANARFVSRLGTVAIKGSARIVSIYGNNRWHVFSCDVPGCSIYFQDQRTQAISSSGSFTINGSSSSPIVLSRLSPDRTSDLDWVMPNPPAAALMWQIDVESGGDVAMSYTTVGYSDARSHPIAVPDSVTLFTVTPDNSPSGEIGATCYQWISGILAIYSYTEDSDGNGKLDRIRVVAQTTLNGAFDDFSAAVDGYTIDRAKGSNGFAMVDASNGPPLPSSPTLYGGAGFEFFIYLVEKPYNDTGLTPSWSISVNNSLKDKSTNKLKLYPITGGGTIMTTPMTTTDTAVPRIAYTLAVPGHAEGFFHFSEPVYADASGSAIAAGNFSGASGMTPISSSGNGVSEALTSYASAVSASQIASGSTSYSLSGTVYDAAVAPHDYANDSAWTPFWITLGGLPPSPYNNAAAAPAWPNPIASTAHRVSDLMIDAPPATAADVGYCIWPIYAKDSVKLSLTTDQLEAMTGSSTAAGGIGLIRSFDGSQWLRDQDITVQARLQPSLSGAGITGIRLWFDSSVPSTFTSSDGLWLPSFEESGFSALVPYPNDLDHGGRGAASTALGVSAGTNLYNFTIPSIDPRIVSVSQLGFFFAFEPSIAGQEPLYAARLEASAGTIPADWYRRVRPFSFSIHDLSLQRGGATILNNVIDPTKGETARLSYQLPSDGAVTITVFTLDGDVVARLANERKSAGDYAVSWNGRNLAGDAVARGLYFIRIVAPGVDEIRKVIVVRKK